VASFTRIPYQKVPWLTSWSLFFYLASQSLLCFLSSHWASEGMLHLSNSYPKLTFPSSIIASVSALRNSFYLSIGLDL
jgi:hypothetical protein